MLIETGKQLVRPCLEGNDPGMIFRRWSPADSLAPGHASVGQPLPEAPAVVPDAIIAPLLAFDRRLNRRGQGGGHYDRTFARYPHALRSDDRDVGNECVSHVGSRWSRSQ